MDEEIYENSDENENGNENENENRNDVINQTDVENSTTNSLQQNNENQSKNEVKIETNHNNNEQIVTNEITPKIQTSEAENDINIVDPSSESCDVNNGGCEHTCTMVPDAELGSNIAECSCKRGFYLDGEGMKCLGEFLLFCSVFFY